jgi:hypothetical protein
MRAPLASLLVALAACGVGGPGGRAAAPAADARPRVEVEPDASPTAAPTAPGPYAVVQGPAGTVLGTVTLAALPPRAAVAPVPGPAACPGRAAMPAVAVAPNGGVVGALVWLEDVARGKPFADAPPADLVVHGCALAPRAVIVPPGGALTVRNDDPVRHEVQLAAAGTLDAPALAGDAPLFTWPMPLEGQRFARTLAEPGLFVAHADGAPRPRALVLVPRHPYVAVTDADGRYRLDGVPPGTYVVRAWHPPLDGGRPLGARATATVAADGAVEVNVALAPPGAVAPEPAAPEPAAPAPAAP